MTEPRMYDDREWSDRLKAALEKTEARRQARAEQRRTQQAARTRGLVLRHAQKLARNREQQTAPDVANTPGADPKENTP